MSKNKSKDNVIFIKIKSASSAEHCYAVLHSTIAKIPEIAEFYSKEINKDIKWMTSANFAKNTNAILFGPDVVPPTFEGKHFAVKTYTHDENIPSDVIFLYQNALEAKLSAINPWFTTDYGLIGEHPSSLTSCGAVFCYESN